MTPFDALRAWTTKPTVSVALAFVWVAFVAGCSALVWSEPRLRCETDDACPQEYRCQGLPPERFCARCEISVEVCDAIDNDCDGFRDEENDDGTPLCTNGATCLGGVCRTGCTTDRDGDGVPVCDPRSDGDDCDDTDADVAPNLAEVCDGKDNDCDLQIDEGLVNDADGDGAFTCQPNDRSSEDCDDYDPEVRPNIAGQVESFERCNGYDDDCNPATGETDSCRRDGADQICATLVGRTAPTCVAANAICRTSPQVCMSGTVCDNDGHCSTEDPTFCPLHFPCELFDGTIGVCRPDSADPAVTCRPLFLPGARCTNGEECSSGLCLPENAVGREFQGGARICGFPCCSDADCEGVVVANGNTPHCADGGRGIRTCVSGTVPEPSTCVADSHCGTGDTCQVSRAGGDENVLVRACRTATSTCVSSNPNDYCGEVDPRACTRVGGRCERFCASDSDCGEGAVCAIETAFDSDTGITSDFATCVPEAQVATRGSAGAACGADSACRSSVCYRGICGRPCCTIGDCGTGQICAPARTGPDRYAMICMPAPPRGTRRRYVPDAGVGVPDASTGPTDAGVAGEDTGPTEEPPPPDAAAT